MANVNKVILIGNLTRDPELKYTQGGTAIAEFGLATNRTYTVDGQKKEDVTFIDIACFGKTADLANQYLSKGRPVYLEGRLKFDQWQGQDGQKRSKLSVIADVIQFLGERQEEKQYSGPAQKEDALPF